MIAYVDSPFQLLQVYELRKQRKGLNKVYIRLNGKIENDKQLKSLAQLLMPDNCKIIRIIKRYEKIYYYSMFLFLGLMHSQIIIGDANSFLFKILRVFLPYSKFILLDDGVATINDGLVNTLYSRFTIFPKYVHNPIINDFAAVKDLITEKKEKIRENDFIVRLGGDEFVVVLPNIVLDEARIVANKLIDKINSDKKDINFTISIGSASYIKDDISISTVIKRADEALYEAKNLGKNTIV